jgi:hypothetical protein
MADRGTAVTVPATNEPVRDEPGPRRSHEEGPERPDGTPTVPRPDLPVFSVGEHTWTRRSVVEALDAAPDAPAARRRLEREIAARTMRLDEASDDIPSAAVRAAIDGLRREHRLLSRDDTDRWLAQHDLTRADLVEWGEGVVALRSFSLDELDAHLEREPVGTTQLAARRWPSLVLSGRYQRGAEALARAAAAWASTRAAGAASARVATPEARPGPHTLELAHRAFLARASADDGALAALVARRRFEWIVVDGTRLVFGHPDAAAEAARSLHDGRPIDEIRSYATLAGAASIDIGSLDGPAQAAFAGAGPGDVLGPLATGTRGDEEVEVWIVTGRREPDLTEPATRRRAAAEHAARALAVAVTKEVVWHGST